MHLKSGRDKGNQDRRDSRCTGIGTGTDQTQAPPGDKQHAILLMFDFNMIPGQDVSNFHHLGGDDVMDFAASRDLQERCSQILASGGANRLDGFAMSRRFSTRYVQGAHRLVPMHWALRMGCEDFRARVSDHLSFIASFRIF